MPFEKNAEKQTELNNIFANHNRLEQADNLHMNYVQQSTGSIMQEQKSIDRFLGMKALEKRAYMTETEEYKLQAIKGRNLSQLMLRSEKAAGDSNEMQAVKESLRDVEYEMSPLNELDVKDTGMLLQQVDVILGSYDWALRKCREYIDNKKPLFYSSRKKMVKETFARLTDEKNQIQTAKRLIENEKLEKYDKLNFKLNNPMDLLVLGQLENSSQVDKVNETRTEAATGANLLSLDDFMSLAGNLNYGNVTYEKGQLTISGNSRLANWEKLEPLLLLLKKDEKQTVANQQMKSRLYELAEERLGKKHPYLSYVREKLEIGGLKSGSVSRQTIVRILSGIVRWSSSTLKMSDLRYSGEAQATDELNAKASIGENTLRMFGAGRLVSQENANREVNDTVREAVKEKIKAIAKTAKRYGVSLPGISAREYSRMSAFPTLITDIAYEAQLEIMKQIHVLSGSSAVTRWKEPELSEGDQGKLQVLSLAVYLAKTEEQKQLAKNAMEDFVREAAFRTAESYEIKPKAAGADAVQEDKNSLNLQDVYNKLRSTDIPFFAAGSEGLDQAVNSRAGTKSFTRNKGRMVQGREYLAGLCQNMSDFSLLRDKGLRDGLNDGEYKKFVECAGNIDLLKNKKFMADMDFVAAELKNTCFKKGFEDFKRTVNSAGNFSHKELAENLGKRILKVQGALEEEDQQFEIVLPLDEEQRKVEISNGEALDRLEQKNESGSRLVKVLLMQQKPCEYLKTIKAGDRTRISGEFWELRNILTLFPKDRAYLRDVTISGQSFKLAQKPDNSLMVSIDGHTITLGMTAQGMSRAIESDMMENTTLYGSKILSSFVNDLNTASPDLGLGRYSRDMFVKYMAGVSGKPETFFNNLDPVLAEEFARRIIRTGAEGAEAAKTVINSVVNDISLMNSQYILNNEETLTLVREMQEHRKGEAGAPKVVFNNAPINNAGNADNQNARDWTDGQKKVIRLLSDLISPEDTWETDKINADIRNDEMIQRSVEADVNQYKQRRIEEYSIQEASKRAENIQNVTQEEFDGYIEEVRRTATEKADELFGEELKKVRVQKLKIHALPKERKRLALTLERNLDGLLEIIKDEHVLNDILDNFPQQAQELRNQITNALHGMLDNDMVRMLRTGLVPEERVAKLNELAARYDAEEAMIKAEEDAQDALEKQKYEENIRKQNEAIDRENALTDEENRKIDEINALRVSEFKVKLDEENKKIREYNEPLLEAHNRLAELKKIIEKETNELYEKKYKKPYVSGFLNGISWFSLQKDVENKYKEEKAKLAKTAPLKKEKTFEDTLEDGSKLVLEAKKEKKKKATGSFEVDYKTAFKRSMDKISRDFVYKAEYMKYEKMTEEFVRNQFHGLIFSDDPSVTGMLENIQSGIDSMLVNDYRDIMGDVQTQIARAADEVFGGGQNQEVRAQAQQQNVEVRQEEQAQEQVQAQQQNAEELQEELEEKLATEDDSLAVMVSEIASQARKDGKVYPADIVRLTAEYITLKKELEAARDVDSYIQRDRVCNAKLGEIKQKLRDYSAQKAARNRLSAGAGDMLALMKNFGSLGTVIEEMTTLTAELKTFENKISSNESLTDEEQARKNELEAVISKKKAVLTKFADDYANCFENFEPGSADSLSTDEKARVDTMCSVMLQSRFMEFQMITTNMKKPDYSYSTAKLSDEYNRSLECVGAFADSIESLLNDYRAIYEDKRLYVEGTVLAPVHKNIDKKLADSRKLINGEDLNEDEEERQKKIKINIGKAVLGNMLKASLTGKEGQGKFLKTVLSHYFEMVNQKDGLNMFASAVRNLKPRALQKDGSPDPKADMANYLSGFLKGAGPLLQKLLQGFPSAGIPKELSMALRDMKENLAPIHQEIVEAQMRGIVERSGGEITNIEIIKSLGAASVGQAFRCRIHGPGINEGEEVVIKLLRPDVKNKLEREKEVLIACARMTDGTQDMPPEVIGGMEATYRGVLARIEEEMDLTMEAGNIMAGAIYDMGYENIGAAKIYRKVKPTQNTLVLDVAEGDTLQKYFDNTKEYIEKTDHVSLAKQYVDEREKIYTDTHEGLKRSSEKLYEKIAEEVKNGPEGQALAGLKKQRDELEALKKTKHNDAANDDELDKINKEIDKLEKIIAVDADTKFKNTQEYNDYNNDIFSAKQKFDTEKEDKIRGLFGEYTDRLEQLQIRQKHVEQMATKWILEGIYNSGFYHGDLHAGNIMISDNKATLIDFGNATKLDDRQRQRVVKMMISATIGDMGIFRHNFHKLLQATSEEKYQAVRGQLGEVLEKVFSLGNRESAGERIMVALSEAQKLGLEIPSEIYNFSQSQQRLQNTLDEMNQYITDMRQKTLEMLNYVTENIDNSDGLVAKYRAMTRFTPNSFMDIMAGILSTHLKASLGQFGFGNTLSCLFKLKETFEG